MRTVRVIAAWLVVWCAAAALAQDGVGERPEQQIGERPVESGAITAPETFATNGFRIESSHAKEVGLDFKPDGNEFDFLSVTATGVFRVGVEKGRPSKASAGVGAYGGPKGNPILIAADNDGNGSLDYLGYYVLDENGEAALSVDDFDADGQADMRIHFREGYVELWYADRWYRVEKRDGQRGIVVDGEWLEVRNENNRPIVGPVSR